ncbi:hypothetical protein PENSPDRAFT_686414 [Peniophora sp. CONT]|nr:hypothetical protein PENSPDRAFT_686414 [Peniophora sp. CONT]
MARLVWERRFKSQCPGVDISIADLVGYTRIGASTRGYNSQSRFFWKPDLLDMHRRLKELRTTGGSEAVRNFRLSRHELVQKAMTQLPELEKWTEAWEERKRDDRYDAHVKRRKDVEARLIASGYDKLDIPQGFVFDWSCKSEHELTETAWKRLFSKLQNELDANRTKRLEDEKNKRILPQ